MKKNIGGSPTGKRVEAPQALTCNMILELESTPIQELKSTETRGSKKIIGRVEPPTPWQIGPWVISGCACAKEVEVSSFLHCRQHGEFTELSKCIVEQIKEIYFFLDMFARYNGSNCNCKKFGGS